MRQKKAGIPSIDLAAALERDVQMLPDNILYGVGTGAMLGGWLALVQGKNARENVSYVTIGILLGALLGVSIGNKTLFISSSTPLDNNEALTPQNVSAERNDGFNPSFFITPQMAKFDLQFNF